MARKGILNLTPNTAARTDAPQAGSAFKHGTVGAVRNNLRDLGARTVQDLDPALIEDTGIQDRLSLDDADIDALRRSIAAHGQQVPILVRPHPVSTGKFQVIYGRRRLAALRGLEIPVKAMIRTLDDDQAVLAQGQENSIRRDLSYIEKVLFVTNLKTAGYSPRVIQDALGIDKTTFYRMGSVGAAVPQPVIEAIGPAPETGRRRWLELTELIKTTTQDPVAVLDQAAGLKSDPELDSNGRFEAYLRAFAHAARGGTDKSARTGDRGHPPSKPLALRDGTVLGEVKRSPKTLSLSLTTKAAPGFADWLEAQADEVVRDLYDRWRTETSTPKA